VRIPGIRHPSILSRGGQIVFFDTSELVEMNVEKQDPTPISAGALVGAASLVVSTSGELQVRVQRPSPAISETTRRSLQGDGKEWAGPPLT
jgi:hypothetical protein